MKFYFLLISLVVVLANPVYAGVEKLLEDYNAIKAGEAAQAEINRLNQRINALEAELNKLKTSDNAKAIERLRARLVELQKEIKRSARGGFSPVEREKIEGELGVIAKGLRASRDGEVSPERGEGVPMPEPALPAGGVAPPPPPPLPGSAGAKGLNIPGFSEEMIQKYQDLKPQNYEGKFGDDGKFPPGLWASIDLMTLSEGNKKLQAFGVKKPSGKRNSDKIIEKAKKNYQASRDLIKKYMALVSKSDGGFSDQGNHVVLRFMVDMLNAYKPNKANIKAIQWPTEALTEKSYKKLLKQIRIAYNRLQDTLKAEQDTKDKLKDIEEAEERERIKALEATRLREDLNSASATDVSNEMIKLFMPSDPKRPSEVYTAVLSLYKADLQKRKKKIRQAPKDVMADFFTLYVKPFLDDQYENDLNTIRAELSKTFLLEIRSIGALKGHKPLSVRHIEDYIKRDRNNAEKDLSLALWRATKIILDDKGDVRLKDKNIIQAESLNKIDPLVYHLVLYALQKELDNAAKPDLRVMIASAVKNEDQDQGVVDSRMQDSLKAAVKTALGAVGVSGPIQITKAGEHYTFDFWDKRDNEAFNNPKTAAVQQVRKVFDDKTAVYQKAKERYTTQTLETKEPVLYPPTSDELPALYTGTLPVDDALVDQLVSILWVGLLDYYQSKYQDLKKIGTENARDRDLIKDAVKGYSIKFSQLFPGSVMAYKDLHKVLGKESDFSGKDIPNYLKQILAIWILTNKPQPKK